MELAQETENSSTQPTETAPSFTPEIFTQLNDTAASAHAVKSSFLANMSHEMRTPLTVILGFADILKRTSLSNEVRVDYLSRIERSGQQLLNLIEDLLDLANIEAGQLCVKRSPTRIRDIARSVLETYQHLADEKKIAFSVAIASDCPDVFESSPERFKQVLTNLVSNAIKFTDRGSVKIEIRRDGDLLCIDVIDTGLGIDQAHQADLFQPFSQVDSSRTRSQGGTGIGLVLSKRLSELLGGELTLKKSVKDVGSTFTFTLPGLGPLTMSSTPVAKESSQPALTGVSILVAEDVIDNQDLFRIVLESAGATVDIVENGQEAVAAAAAGTYDVILMDVQMPMLDGLSATRQIRAAGATLPIIALTAHAMPEEVAKSKAAGCSDHVSKPISANTLVGAVMRHLGRSH